MMTNQKIFKVVKIPSNSSVVINGGLNYHLNEGDKLEVFVRGEDVYDPETNENLGTLDYVKANLEIVQVLPRMSVCKNASTHTRSKFRTDPFARRIEVRNALNLNESEITGEFAQQDSVIRIGDTVRLKPKN